jgi:hypothetical protein
MLCFIYKIISILLYMAFFIFFPHVLIIVNNQVLLTNGLLLFVKVPPGFAVVPKPLTKVIEINLNNTYTACSCIAG